MSPSPESIAVNEPLSIIADLYAQASPSTAHDGFFDTVGRHFTDVLADHASSIPRLEDVSQKGKLVRFRCMIQDTGLANEVYVLDIGGEKGRGCCAFSEGAISGSPVLGYESTDYSKLRERQVVYATSVPGETDWYRASFQSSESDDNEGGDALASDLAQRLQVGSNPAYTPPTSLANKYPLGPRQPHTGALVKLYPMESEQEKHLKSTDVVEFVGVLDYAYFPTASAEEEAAAQPHELVKTLHAIYRIPQRLLGRNPAERARQGWLEARNQLIQYLAQPLGGDRLAAELLLLSLYGKIHARRGALALGQLPLNLDLSATPGDFAVSSFYAVLSSLLPRLVKLDFNINSLNSDIYTPESKDENLVSGMLQLPTDTALLVDESRMVEGTLKDRGVRNVQSLTQVVNDQTLAYVFPYSSFTFETDFKILVISRGKSLLPVECVVPVQPSNASNNDIRPSEVQMQKWREMLQYQPGAEFSIPEEMSEHIQSDFVASRQTKSVTQEDLVLRMTMARLLTLSLGKNKLDEETWKMTKTLDEDRKARF